jgi:hypothetical protein
MGQKMKTSDEQKAAISGQQVVPVSVVGQLEFVAASLPRQMAVPQGGTASTSN